MGSKVKHVFTGLLLCKVLDMHYYHLLFIALWCKYQLYFTYEGMQVGRLLFHRHYLCEDNAFYFPFILPKHNSNYWDVFVFQKKHKLALVYSWDKKFCLSLIKIVWCHKSKILKTSFLAITHLYILWKLCLKHGQ